MSPSVFPEPDDLDLDAGADGAQRARHPQLVRQHDDRRERQALPRNDPDRLRLKLLHSSLLRTAALAAIAAAGLLAAFTIAAPGPVSAATQTGDCTPGSSWPAANGTLASQVMTLINQHRASIGEGQLVTSPTLSASAVWKARHMAAYNYFGHDDPAPPVARTAADRVATCGYSASWGENIAEGFTTAAAAVNAWLGSAGHRANIENASFVATGIGAATSSNGVVYWVQDFGVVADGGSPPPPATTTPPPPTTTTTTPPPTTTTSTTAGPTTTGATTTTAAAPPSGHGATKVSSLTLKVVQVRVRAGRLVVAARVSTGTAPPSAAAVTCAARVGRADLRVVVNAYRGALARCAWRLPKVVRKGAVVRGWIRVRDGGLHVRRTFRLPLS